MEDKRVALLISFMTYLFPPKMILLGSLMRIDIINKHTIFRNFVGDLFNKNYLKIFFIFLVFLIPPYNPIQVSAQNNIEIPKLSIQTQSYIFNQQEGSYLYRNAKVEWENISVEGTEIIYHPDTNKITAKGYVRVTEGNTIAVMDELEINIKRNSGIFKNTIVYDSLSKAYMTAKEVRRLGENHYIAINCTFTTCNPKSPVWEITGSEINYFSQNFSSSTNSSLKINGIPVFYFPYLAWPTVKRRQTGFLPPEYMIVRSSLRKWDLGYRIGIPYFWAIDPEHDLTFTYDWVERRGPGIRLDYQYAWIKGTRGQVKYQRFFERDPRDPENESGSLKPEEIDTTKLNPKRFKFNIDHNQMLDSQSRLIISGLVYSDSQFRKEYELSEVSSPNSAQEMSVNLNRQFSNGSISLAANQTRVFKELALLNRNIDNTHVQYLPAFSFQFSDTFWRTGKTAFTRSISGSLIRYYRLEGYNGEGITALPRLNFQFPILKNFNLDLTFGEQFSSYKVRDPNLPGSEDSYGFKIFEGKAEINTTFSKIFRMETGIFSRFKHLLKPRFLYDYVEDVEQTSDSDVPFGGGVSTRRLASIRLENILLSKRRFFERSVKLTSLSLDRMRRNFFDPIIIRKLELIQGKEYASEKLFFDRLERLFGESLNSQQKDAILSYSEKGVIPLNRNQARGQTFEGKSKTLATLDFVQHYDFLKKDHFFYPLGPDVKGNETEPGQPLLPLRTIFTFSPNAAFSINLFNRYHHQKKRVVEYSAAVNVGMSKHNKASVNFRNNEVEYQTPFGNNVASANTFGFSNNFETSDELAFGFSGIVNLDADNYTFRRRLSSSTLTLDYSPDCWNIRFALTEEVDKTTTSSGNEKEYIDRTLIAYINLGGISIPEQIFPDLD